MVPSRKLCDKSLSKFEISFVLPKRKQERLSKATYIVVIVEASLLVGIDPFNWFQLRSLKIHAEISAIYFK